MRILKHAIALMLLPLVGCTHLSTMPDTQVTPLDQALNGQPYALPMLQYKLDVARSLKKCPSQATLEGSGAVPSITLTDTSLVFQVKVTPTARYVAGERYTTDYRALTSILKTTGYGLSTYPSGVLKSVNVSADDHTADVVKAAAATGLTVATLGAGSPIAASALLATVTTVGAGGARGPLGGHAHKVVRVDPDYAAALHALDRLSTTSKIVVCTPEAIAALASIKKNADAQEAATKDLAAATKDVARFTILANLKKARDSDVTNLDAALKLQDARTLTLQTLTDERTGLDTEVAVSEIDYWPRRPLDSLAVLAPSRDDIGKLHKLLDTATVRTITPTNLQNWYQGLSSALRKTIWAKNKDLLKPYIREDGTVIRVDPIVPTPCTASTPDIDACLMSSVTITSSLVESSGSRLACAPGEDEKSGCVTHMSVAADQKAGRFAMDDKPDPGIFIRTPAEGLFTVCRRPDHPEAECPVDQQLAHLDAVATPQLGQLRFLAFSSRPFEAATLSVSLREDGSLDTLSYAKTKAAGPEAAAAANDLANQVQTYITQRDAKQAASLTAVRTEAIAEIQFQIDALTKQAELLKLQTRQSPDALAAINDETAKINAQTALLSAKLAQLNAQASLTAAGGQ